MSPISYSKRTASILSGLDDSVRPDVAKQSGEVSQSVSGSIFARISKFYEVEQNFRPLITICKRQRISFGMKKHHFYLLN
ncbi:hypothetical protein SCA6_001273, partial [Theobroma cacao]